MSETLEIPVLSVDIVKVDIIEEAQEHPHLRDVAIFILKMRIKECRLLMALGSFVAALPPLAIWIVPVGESFLALMGSLFLRLIFGCCSSATILIVWQSWKNLRRHEETLFLCRLTWPEVDSL